jgi:hypothetical protein
MDRDPFRAAGLRAVTLPLGARAGLAFVVIFMGGMAFGSIFWGQAATRIRIPGALTMAAAGWLSPLRSRGDTSWAPSGARLHSDDGHAAARPCRTPSWRASNGDISTGYGRSAHGSSRRCRRARMRRRNGAYIWQLVHDVEDPTVFVGSSWTNQLGTCASTNAQCRRSDLNRAKAFHVEGRRRVIIRLAIASSDIERRLPDDRSS